MRLPLDDPHVRRTAVGVALGVVAGGIALALLYAALALTFSFATAVPGGWIAVLVALVLALALLTRAAVRRRRA